VTTDSRHQLPIAPNRLRQRFAVRRPNRVWSADITACWTREGWCYLAIVLDLASRRVVGWAVATAPTAQLVMTALTGALPRITVTTRVLHHSDRGTQYASAQYQVLLARHGIRVSMSRAGNCWDNAPVESFFSTFKAEAMSERPWLDVHEATDAVADYIDFYNRRRLHSSLDYRSPVAFEAALKAAV
jgi:transposase InsO family protein